VRVSELPRFAFQEVDRLAHQGFGRVVVLAVVKLLQRFPQMRDVLSREPFRPSAVAPLLLLRRAPALNADAVFGQDREGCVQLPGFGFRRVSPELHLVSREKNWR
jgi:hypothetical protein